MKKVICLLLISVICFSLFGCSAGPMPETLSCYAEYDGVGFDPYRHIESGKSSGGEVVELQISPFSFDIDKDEGHYIVRYSDGTLLCMSIFQDVDAAAACHKEYKETYAFEKAENPYAFCVRIDNTVFWGANDRQNKGIIRLLKELGIPDEQIRLQKNNSHWRIARRDTDKSIFGIMQAFSDKGYMIIAENRVNRPVGGEEHSAVMLYYASEDYSSVYEVYIFSGKYANHLCLSTLSAVFEWDRIKNNAGHAYYSFGDGYAMFILGVSENTKNLWDEIR